MSIPSIATMAAMTAGFVRTEPGGSMAQHAAARTDYELLLGTWQFTRRVVNGKPVPASVLRNTILITDHNTFRLPKASGVGTHPAGSFTVNPGTRPRQVDSIAAGGPHAGQQREEYTRFSIPTISAPVGDRPVARGQQSSSLLQEAAGFFSIGKNLGRCRPIKHCEGESGVIL
jgi:uncharacterized protein (TIGR03067 family)